MLHIVRMKNHTMNTILEIFFFFGREEGQTKTNQIWKSFYIFDSLLRDMYIS